MSCLGWPTRVTNPQHRLDVRNAPTILMLNALHDPATGYSWATNAHRQLQGTAVLVTYEGWGHAVYGRGPCTVRTTDRYLLNRVVPKEGSRCPAVLPDGPLARTRNLVPVPLGPCHRGPVPACPAGRADRRKCPRWCPRWDSNPHGLATSRF